MCLILLAHRVHERYPLILAANRDEFHARPTVPAAFWPDHAGVLAGRDLVGGGTWLGAARSGRIAAVTNVREPDRYREDAPSRGALVADFLSSRESASGFSASVASRAAELNGFNLLLWDEGDLLFASNRDEHGSPAFVTTEVTPGIHGVSNASFDTPWPKVVRGRNALKTAIEPPDPDPDTLFALLADESMAVDEDLPDTGVGLETERALSAARIRLPRYGTRSSTVVLVSTDGHVTFMERTWPTRDGVPEMRRIRFGLEMETLQP